MCVNHGTPYASIIHFSCPDNTFFDSHINGCNFADQVECLLEDVSSSSNIFGLTNLETTVLQSTKSIITETSAHLSNPSYTSNLCEKNSLIIY